MMRTLGRLILVPLGFVLATMGAIAILLTLGLERFTQATHGRNFGFDEVGQLFELARGAAGLATVATLVPALLFVIVGEVARIRAPLYYIVGGGLALSAPALLARIGSPAIDLSGIGVVWQVFATAGFFGGAVYWLVAGRRA